MAAGLGFKTFTTGEVLTAADVNGYLMQGVLVFASAAARNAAITSPQEGQFAFTKDTNGLWYYDGAAWVASGATGDIEGVTAGVGITGGGTSGTVTITNDMATTITAAGDIVVGTGSGTYDNLPIGTTAQVLTADTTVSPYKVKWATPAGAASGLTLVKAQTIGSAVSSVEVTSAFSATYDNYLVTITGGAGSADSLDVSIQFGATTSGYAYSGTYQSTTSATLNTYAVDSVSQLGFCTLSTLGASGEVFITSPFLSSRTGTAARGTPLVSGDFRTDYAGRLSNTTSYTSFKLGFSGGTMTGGTIRVYGYQNS